MQNRYLPVAAAALPATRVRAAEPGVPARVVVAGNRDIAGVPATATRTKRLANVGNSRGSLWLKHGSADAWAAGAGLYFVDRRPGDVRNTFQLPGYARVDGMLSYGWAVAAGRATVEVNVDNLFDTRYYASSHQFVQDWIRPGTSRTARLTLRPEH